MFGNPQPEPTPCASQHILQLRTNLEKCYKMVKRNINTEQIHQKDHYYKRQEGDSFQKIHDKVQLYFPTALRGQSRKLYHQWHGPYAKS